MALHDKVAELRQARLAATGQSVPESLQGVTKDKIRNVLHRLHLGGNNDLVDGVFALLDNETPSWFANAPRGAHFANGASTAHLACHIGILQRGAGKLDREGRDYWIKPLRELGGIDPVTLYDGAFIDGHVIAKSPNSAYRLNAEFASILRAADAEWPDQLAKWSTADAARQRRAFQAELAARSRSAVDTSHSDLIRGSIDYYAARFLPGFRVIYVDDGDGDRITEDDRERLREAGLELRLGDAMPDVLLWHPGQDRLWVIEAVTSDGEVDFHKVDQVRALSERSGKAGVDFTTTYRTWKDAAARQGAHQNVAVGTYIWIEADPARQLRVESFTTDSDARRSAAKDRSD
ncbi:MAG: BsuBI/PstI family type II restriction endonuclease [Pseudomonadota bacterium]